MHCVPARQPRACWEHLRAGLHPTEPKTGSSGAPGLRRKDETIGLPGNALPGILRRFLRQAVGEYCYFAFAVCRFSCMADGGTNVIVKSFGLLVACLFITLPSAVPVSVCIQS